MSRPPAPLNWPGIRIRVQRKDGVLSHWSWEVTNGLNVVDYGYTMLRAKAVRQAEKAAGKERRRRQYGTDVEVWDFDPSPPEVVA